MAISILGILGLWVFWLWVFWKLGILGRWVFWDGTGYYNLGYYVLTPVNWRLVIDTLLSATEFCIKCRIEFSLTRKKRKSWRYCSSTARHTFREAFVNQNFSLKQTFEKLIASLVYVRPFRLNI